MTMPASDTGQQVEDWRAAQLIAAGYPADDALELAARSDVDLHQAVALLKNGCPIDVAARILR
jgi:hypothetical protein